VDRVPTTFPERAERLWALHSLVRAELFMFTQPGALSPNELLEALMEYVFRAQRWWKCSLRGWFALTIVLLACLGTTALSRHRGLAKALGTADCTVPLAAAAVALALDALLLALWAPVHQHCRSVAEAAANNYRHLRHAMMLSFIGAFEFAGLDSVDAEKAKFDSSMCVICLEPFAHGNLVARLPCGHLFHADCISDWLFQRAVCPLRCECSIPTLVSMRRSGNMGAHRDISANADGDDVAAASSASSLMEVAV